MRQNHAECSKVQRNRKAPRTGREAAASQGIRGEKPNPYSRTEKFSPEKEVNSSKVSKVSAQAGRSE